MRNIIKHVSIIVGLVAGCATVSCNDVEDDVIEPTDESTVMGEGNEFQKIYTEPGHTLIVNIARNNLPSNYKILEQPKRGTLEALQQGIYVYRPNESFKNGRDNFTYLKKEKDSGLETIDTVQIVIPNGECKPVSRIDSVETTINTALLVNPLLNDEICKAGYPYSFYMKNTPHGHAEWGMDDKQIYPDSITVYPNTDYEGRINIVYGYQGIEQDEYTYSLMSVNVQGEASDSPDCTIETEYDFYHYPSYNPTFDWVKVLENDNISCEGAGLYIDEQPKRGSARVIGNKYISYSPNYESSFMDTLKYRVQKGDKYDVTTLIISRRL
ncbi:MAG: hypothetical protein WBB45_18410 [Cyclobacteriaceae bacterium]